MRFVLSGRVGGMFSRKLPIDQRLPFVPLPLQQHVEADRHDLRRFDHVGDADPLVGPVGEVENARAVGDAVVEVADAGNVLLVVGAGRDDIVRLAAEYLADAFAPPPSATGASRSVISGSTSMTSRIS